jgi:serine/threonine protein phosphatase PrpC
VHQLVEAAVGNGGRDNVTVVVVDVLRVVRRDREEAGEA